MPRLSAPSPQGLMAGPVALGRWLGGLADYFGAHHAPDRAEHERSRALWRAVLGLGVAGFWLAQHLAGRPVPVSPWFAAFLGIAVPVCSLAYRRILATHPQGAVAAQYAFLVLDPVALVGTLLQDPNSFAFLHPLLLVVLVDLGIRFGVRTMHFAFAVALGLCTLLTTSDFWRANLALTGSLLLTLALVPAFFAPLVRRLESSRSIEEARARAAQAHQLALARSAFLAKVSHELRSPLQGIVSALDVIEMRHARALAGDEELIGRMRRSSMLLNTQLRDLLTLAKGEAGRLQIHAEPFEACALVEAMAEAARELADAKGLKLKLDLPPPPVFAIADAARIDQVLTNLVVNSIRYTDAGEVRIAMEAVGSPARSLGFVVADTGPGIPEDVLPTLLEPDRSVSTSARRGEGSGIGLAIVRTLVEHLGGNLRVTSALGQGTIFRVEIPAEFAPADAQK